MLQCLTYNVKLHVYRVESSREDVGRCSKLDFRMLQRHCAKLMVMATPSLSVYDKLWQALAGEDAEISEETLLTLQVNILQ